MLIVLCLCWLFVGVYVVCVVCCLCVSSVCCQLCCLVVLGCVYVCAFEFGVCVCCFVSRVCV